MSLSRQNAAPEQCVDDAAPMCMPQDFGSNDQMCRQLDATRARDETGVLDGLFGDSRQVEGREVGGDQTTGFGGTLSSISRTLDRVAASVELRDRFDVVPNDFVGPRLPNQVTEAEYSQIVNTYSDIRTGNSNVRFDNSQLTGDAATNFQSNTMNDMASMMQTPSGRELLSGMAYGRNADGSAHTMTIRGISNPGGAQAIPAVNANTSNPRAGTNTTIEYAPGQSILNPGAPGQYGSVRSDMTLYHEMVHAYHMRTGTEDQAVLNARTATDRKDIGTNAWEYQAMGLGSHANDPYSENRYRAERRAMGESDQRRWDRYNP